MDEIWMHDELERMEFDSSSGAVLNAEALRVPLHEVPMKPALTMEAGNTVAEAVELMERKSQGCVVVTEAGKLCGIFTERDALLRVLRQSLDPRDTALADVMTPDPEVLTRLQTLRFAVHLMVNGGLRHVPVTDRDGSVLGVVSARDVLDYIGDQFPLELRNLPPRPSDYMAQYGG